MTKTPWIVGAAMAATLAATGYAYAKSDDGPPRTRVELQARIAEHFRKADSNSDGFVTRAEFDTAREAMKAKFAEHREERREKVFAMLDTNKDGQLSKAEFTAPHQRPDGHSPDGMGDPEGRGGPDGPDGHEGMRHGGHRDGGHRGGRMMHGGGMAMGMGEGWFDRADADHDGKISLAEASAGPLAMFDKVDTNRDGTISSPEHEAARAAMRAKWQERGGGDAR